jgi:hypothetical protein
VREAHLLWIRARSANDTTACAKRERQLHARSANDISSTTNQQQQASQTQINNNNTNNIRVHPSITNHQTNHNHQLQTQHQSESQHQCTFSSLNLVVCILLSMCILLCASCYVHLAMCILLCASCYVHLAMCILLCASCCASYDLGIPSSPIRCPIGYPGRLSPLALYRKVLQVYQAQSVEELSCKGILDGHLLLVCTCIANEHIV